MNETIWKDVVGYEGLYSVSNTGKVWSHIREKELQPMSCRGYLRVHLCKNGRTKAVPIHRIVAMAFIANPSNKPTVNHINEDKLDNRVENLEWATVAENNNHGTRTQRAMEHTDFKARAAKIDYSVVASKHDYYAINKPQMKPVVQMAKDGTIIRRYDNINEAARSINGNSCAIRLCLKRGSEATSGGFRWAYA